MRILYFNEKNIKEIENVSICLGYFDAFHLGHLSLIKKAKSFNTKVGVLSFEPNPKTILGEKDKYINSLERKIEILEDLNVDYFIILKVNKEFLSLNPVDFVNKYLIPLKPINVICGFDYHFGNNRSGDVELLKELSKDHFALEVLPQLSNENNQKISTSYIQKLIEEGNVKLANKYLSHIFEIKGKVIYGNQIGRTLSFPTANIKVEKKQIVPKNGVYRGNCIIDDKSYLSMINVGTHPTIKESENILIEAHIFNFDKDIYDEEITIQFEEFIRPEIKFDSLDELKKQLSQDKEKIKKNC